MPLIVPPPDRRQQQGVRTHAEAADRKLSLLIYLGLLALLVLTFIIGQLLDSQGWQVRLIGWDALTLGALGFPLMYLQTKAGFVLPWDSGISKRERFTIPLLIGTVFGILDIVVIEGLVRTAPHTSMPPYTQPFPYSVLLYSSGAFYVELLHRLIPLTLILVVIRTWLKGRAATTAFWTLAVLSACVEPLQQLPDGSAWLIIYSLASGFLFNLLQAVYLRNAGLLASLTIRLGHYLWWHILLGMYIQFIVLR